MCRTEEFTHAAQTAEEWITRHAPAWNGAGSRTQRCLGVVNEGSGNNGRSTPVPVSERWRKCTQCGARIAGRETHTTTRCLS
jgi:hypothetical protein